MDTSETYIKMCEKAEEIQDGWDIADWDYCYCEKGERVVVLSGYETDGGFYGHGVETDFWEEGKPNKIICNEDSDVHIWLPRQDQLQEMVGDWEKQIEILDDWLGNAYDPPSFKGNYWCINNLTSMEQLWLAFVMKEKYNKVWNGEEWITI